VTLAEATMNARIYLNIRENGAEYFDSAGGNLTMRSCLLVDDSRAIRGFARRIVEKLAFTCQEAADGESALSVCGDAMPQVILLDWNMPGISGIDCLKAIRAMPGGRCPKIIFCTTNTQIAQIARALEEGADEYIMKPFDDEILRSKFEQVGLL
jgi:two-component system, chemotaxis family, chemotaxis protein CheY